MAAIDAGADVILADTDQAARGAFSAAEGAGVYVVATYDDQSSLAPKAILGSVLYDYGALLRQMVVNAAQGKLEKGKEYKLGLADGFGGWAPNPALQDSIPAEAKKKFDSGNGRYQEPPHQSARAEKARRCRQLRPVKVECEVKGSRPSRWRTPMNSALRATGISKAYGTVRANAEVDVDIRRGEIHAILGENGAGKSTLMRILYGMEVPDAGQIELDGKPIVLRSPREAIKLGIGMVHQHFMLVPTLTVLENLILGNQTAGRGVLNLSSARSAHCRAGETLSYSRRSRSKGQSTFGRRSATRRNSQSLGPPRKDPDPGRANRRVDAAGDCRSHGDASQPRAPRLQHFHRHPQDSRGHGGQRPRERDARSDT